MNREARSPGSSSTRKRALSLPISTGLGIESDRGAAHNAVETVIQEHDAVLAASGFNRPPTLPAMAAKLKDISEVRREIKHKLEGVRVGAKAVYAEPLVARAVEEKL